MNTNHYCVILAGGSGHCFWPTAREDRPKEFLAITGSSFLRQTYERFARIVPRENILIVTLARYEAAARRILPDFPKENLLLEKKKTTTEGEFHPHIPLIRDFIRDELPKQKAICARMPDDRNKDWGPLNRCFAETIGFECQKSDTDSGLVR